MTRHFILKGTNSPPLIPELLIFSLMDTGHQCTVHERIKILTGLALLSATHYPRTVSLRRTLKTRSEAPLAVLVHLWDRLIWVQHEHKSPLSIWTYWPTTTAWPLGENHSDQYRSTRGLAGVPMSVPVSS